VGPGSAWTVATCKGRSGSAPEPHRAVECVDDEVALGVRLERRALATGGVGKARVHSLGCHYQLVLS